MASLEASHPTLKSGSVRLSREIGGSKMGESIASEVVCRNPNFPIPIDKKTKQQFRVADLFTAAGTGDTSLFRSFSEDQLSWALSLRYIDGCSLLFYAASLGRIDVVRFLIEADSSRSLLDTVDDRGWAPVHISCLRGYPDIVEILIRHGANVNQKNGNGDTPLHIAAYYGMLEMVRVLILHGAEVNARNKVGCIPLHKAVWRGKLNVCELLISAGAEIDAADRVGQTPLTHAVICDQKEIALLLMRHGADMTDKKEYAMLGRYPADYKDGELKVRTQIPGRVRLSGCSPVMNGAICQDANCTQTPDESSHCSADPRLLQESEIFEMANVALSSYNKKRGLSSKGCGYELVKTIGGTCLPKTRVHHLNFLARPINGSEAETRLFFAEVKWKWGVWSSLCSIMGPVGTVTRLRRCKICNKCPGRIQHPLHKKAFTVGC